MTSPRKRRPVLWLVALASLFAFYFIPMRIGGQDKLVLTSALVRAASGETVTLSAPVTLSRDPAIVLEKGLVSIESADKSAGLKTLLAMLASGTASLLIDEAVISIGGAPGPSVGATGALQSASVPTSTLPASSSIVAALEGYKFDTLKVRRTILRYSDGHRMIDLGSVASDISLGNRGSAVAKGVLNRNGRDVNFELAMQPSSNSKDMARSAIRGRFESPLITADFDGHVSRGTALQVVATQSKFAVTDVQDLADWLGETNLGATGIRTFSAKGPFEWSGSALAFQSGDIVIDGNAAVGSLSIAPAADRLSVEGTLDFASLDLGPYLDADRSDGGSYGLEWLTAHVATTPGVSLIESMNVDLRVSAGELVIGSHRLGRGAAAVAMKDGRLNANIAEIEFAEGGSGEGLVSVDVRGDIPRYKLSGELRDLDAAWAGRMFFDRALFDGNATLAGELSASGSSLTELLPTLDGQFSIAAPEAGVLGLDLDAIMATKNTVKAADPLSRAWRKSATKGLNIRLSATNGLLTTEAAEVTINRSRFKAAGTLDLRDQSLDLSLVRSTADGASADPQSVRIRGELAKPAVSSDVDDRAGGGVLNGPSEPVKITLH